jgi:hypothetical protein
MGRLDIIVAKVYIIDAPAQPHLDMNRSSNDEQIHNVHTVGIERLSYSTE